MADKRGNFAVLFAVTGYMTCSALMLLVNKLAVFYLPAPSFVLMCQLITSALTMVFVGKTGLATVDALEWGKVKRFYIVPFAFLATIFANIKILQHANVETFIVFRVSTPLIISLLEYQYLGRELPSRRSWLCLFVLLLGGLAYVSCDKFFSVDAYFWVGVWYTVFTFDQVYIKHVVDAVKMTTWGRVYYTNLIASVPLIFTMAITGEFQLLSEFEWTLPSIVALSASCVMGTAIAWFAFEARKTVSAAYFTVIGNTCKVLTVLLNHFMWDLHATPCGVAALMTCLAAAYFYKQAPKRNSPSVKGRTGADKV